MADRYYNAEGKVGVVLSHKSWSMAVHLNAMEEWCLFAPEVVEWVVNGKQGGQEALVAIAEARWNDDRPDCSDAMSLYIEWVDPAMRFVVEMAEEGEVLRPYRPQTPPKIFRA